MKLNGKKLKEFREAKGLNREAFAAAVGIPNGTIKDMEQEITALPSHDKLVTMSAFLGVPIAAFVDEGGRAKRTPAEKAPRGRYWPTLRYLYCGTITAGEPAGDCDDDGPGTVTAAELLGEPDQLFVCRVCGHSMEKRGIHNGYLAVFRAETEPRNVRPGTVIAVQVNGGHILKEFGLSDTGAPLLKSRSAGRPRRDIPLSDEDQWQLKGVYLTCIPPTKTGSATKKKK